MKKNFWKNKKVFITGHSGFKGSWLTLWLKNLGAKINGYSLKPKKKSLFYEANIANGIESNFENILNFKKLSEKINKFSPEIVFHLAAQPLVKPSYKNPRKTFSTTARRLRIDEGYTRTMLGQKSTSLLAQQLLLFREFKIHSYVLSRI